MERRPDEGGSVESGLDEDVAAQAGRQRARNEELDDE